MLIDRVAYYSLYPFKILFGTFITSLAYFLPHVHGSDAIRGYTIFLFVLSVVYIIWVMLSTISFLFILYRGESILGGVVDGNILELKQLPDTTRKRNNKKKVGCNIYRSILGIVVGIWSGAWLGFYIGWGFDIGFWVGLGLALGFAFLFALILGLSLGRFDFTASQLFEIRKKYTRYLRIFDYVDLIFSIWSSFGLVFTFLQILDPDQITSFPISIGSFTDITLSLWQGYYFTVIITTTGFTQFIAVKFFSQLFVTLSIIVVLVVKLLIFVTFDMFLRKYMKREGTSTKQ